MEHFFQKAVLEFKKQNTEESIPFVPLSATASEILEVQWFDSENGNWTTIKETFTKFISMGKINHLFLSLFMSN
jgi:hypothetical protein